MCLPTEKKYLIIGAPHTSNWDFPLAILALSAMGLPFSWVGKHTLFHFPFGYVFRALGGIPVDRQIHEWRTSQKVVVLYRRKKGTGGEKVCLGQLQLSKARSWSGNSQLLGHSRFRTVETCNMGSIQ